MGKASRNMGTNATFKTSNQETKIDMSVIGEKQNLAEQSGTKEKNRMESGSRNINEQLQRSQIVKPTTVNFPLNLPTNTINSGSPMTSDKLRSQQALGVSGGTLSVLTLP